MFVKEIWLKLTSHIDPHTPIVKDFTILPHFHQEKSIPEKKINIDMHKLIDVN